MRVILTRDDDRALTLDERAAFANNSKADLFLSLHANGALGPGIAGAEVYSPELDQEGEDASARRQQRSLSLPVLGGGRRLLEVVPWDLAQARACRRIGLLAAMLEEELRRRVPMSPRPVQRAPHARAHRSQHAGCADRDGLSDQSASRPEGEERRLSRTASPTRCTTPLHASAPMPRSSWRDETDAGSLPVAIGVAMLGLLAWGVTSVLDT